MFVAGTWALNRIDSFVERCRFAFGLSVIAPPGLKLSKPL